MTAEESILSAAQLDLEFQELVKEASPYLVPALVAGGGSALLGGSAASNVEKEDEDPRERRARIIRNALGAGAAGAGAAGLGVAGLNQLNEAVPEATDSEAGDAGRAIGGLLGLGIGNRMGAARAVMQGQLDDLNTIATTDQGVRDMLNRANRPDLRMSNRFKRLALERFDNPQLFNEAVENLRAANPTMAGASRADFVNKIIRDFGVDIDNYVTPASRMKSVGQQIPGAMNRVRNANWKNVLDDSLSALRSKASWRTGGTKAKSLGAKALEGVRRAYRSNPRATGTIGGLALGSTLAMPLLSRFGGGLLKDISTFDD